MKHRFALSRLAACAVVSSALLSLPVRAEGPAGEPAEAFARLEARLLAADSVSLEFHITAEGALAADLQGKLRVGTATPRPHNMLLSLWGEFAGQQVSAILSATDTSMALGSGDELVGEPRSEHLAEAVLIGLTRMGLLHNLARLLADATPDHADGGVRDWVAVGDFATDSEEPAALSFAITVAGTPAATARLELDAAGLPHLRQQTVQFPGGEMRVTERYSAVAID
ncbi:hypothetical protein [Haliea sp.]